MITTIRSLLLFGVAQTLWVANLSALDLEKYPSTVIANEHVKLKVYLPDPEKGVYRATRYDWSGLIGSAQYKGHEYFGFWKDAYDPMIGIFGPADTYKMAGLGYDEAKPGETFIRIGVGAVQKEAEPNYDYHNQYKLVDSGKWTIDAGADVITFTHQISNARGYGYRYIKTIRLEEDGFEMEHRLRNTGTKIIETDQYNHNFFMIDQEKCGPALSVVYPFPISTTSDLKGLMEVKDRALHFPQALDKGSIFAGLSGYGKSAEDNRFTIKNEKSGAQVTVSVDRPLIKMEFWSNSMVLCPENSIQLSVKPGEETVWTAVYTFSAK